MFYYPIRSLRFKERLPLLRGGLRLLLRRVRVVREPGRDRGHHQDGQQVQDKGQGAQSLGKYQGACSVEV